MVGIFPLATWLNYANLARAGRLGTCPAVVSPGRPIYQPGAWAMSVTARKEARTGNTRIKSIAASVSTPSCPGCGATSLELCQPDHGDPDRLIGVCHECGGICLVHAPRGRPPRAGPLLEW